jgi:ANTAR domain
MVGGGVGSPSDEQLVARFSGRLDNRVGRFLGRPQTDQWVWDDQLDAILGCLHGGESAPLQTLLQHVVDEERSLVADAFRAAVEQGDPVMVSCRLHTADRGSVRSVLIAAEVSDDEPKEQSMSALLRTDGLAAVTGPWLAGQMVDLTTLRLGATRAATNHAVSEAAKHRAVIEQAKGILMVTHRLDADTAFELLRRHSQNTNTKVQDLAAHLVAHAARLHLDETIRAQLDPLLHQPG